MLRMCLLPPRGGKWAYSPPQPSPDQPSRMPHLLEQLGSKARLQWGRPLLRQPHHSVKQLRQRRLRLRWAGGRLEAVRHGCLPRGLGVGKQLAGGRMHSVRELLLPLWWQLVKSGCRPSICLGHLCISVAALLLVAVGTGVQHRVGTGQPHEGTPGSLWVGALPQRLQHQRLQSKRRGGDAGWDVKPTAYVQDQYLGCAEGIEGNVKKEIHTEQVQHAGGGGGRGGASAMPRHPAGKLNILASRPPAGAGFQPRKASSRV